MIFRQNLQTYITFLITKDFPLLSNQELDGHALWECNFEFGSDFESECCFPFRQSYFINLFDAGLQCEFIWTFFYLNHKKHTNYVLQGPLLSLIPIKMAV